MTAFDAFLVATVVFPLGMLVGAHLFAWQSRRRP